MNGLSGLRSNVNGPLVAAGERVIYSTTVPIVLEAEGNDYFKILSLNNPQINLTERAIYFMCDDSSLDVQYAELLNIKSYGMNTKAGGKSVNKLSLEIIPVSTAHTTEWTFESSSFFVEITFCKRSKKPIPGERTPKEEYNLFLAHLTGAIEAYTMTTSILGIGSFATKSFRDRTSVVLDVVESPILIPKEKSFFPLFDPIHYSVYGYASLDSPQPLMEQPSSDVLLPILGFPSTDIPSSLDIPTLRLSDSLLGVINRLALECFKLSSNAVIRRGALGVLQTLNQENNPCLLQSGSLQMLIPRLSVSPDNSFMDRLEQSNSQQVLDNIDLVSSSGVKSIDRILVSYRTYLKEVVVLPLNDYVASFCTIYPTMQLTSPVLTAETIAQYLPSLLFDYLNTSPFYASAHFKLIPIDEAFLLLNRIRPAYPVSIDVFSNAVRIAEQFFLKGRENKIPINRFPAYVPWNLDGIYYYVEIKMRAGMLFDTAIVGLLYNEFNELRANRDSPSSPKLLYTFITANDVALRLSLTQATSTHLLNSLVKRLLLVVEEVDEEQRYYLNRITNHYRAFQKQLLQTKSLMRSL